MCFRVKIEVILGESWPARVNVITRMEIQLDLNNLVNALERAYV